MQAKLGRSMRTRADLQIAIVHPVEIEVIGVERWLASRVRRRASHHLFWWRRGRRLFWCRRGRHLSSTSDQEAPKKTQGTGKGLQRPQVTSRFSSRIWERPHDLPRLQELCRGEATLKSERNLKGICLCFSRVCFVAGQLRSDEPSK